MPTLPPPAPILDAAPAMEVHVDSPSEPSVHVSIAPHPVAPDDAEAAYFEALRAAGLFEDLNDALLAVLQERVTSHEEDVRRLDLIELYYDAGGDVGTADRRWAADRMVLFRADNGATARSIVSALSQTHPSLSDTRLERLGGEDGPLVLRSGEHISAVDDEESASDPHNVSVRALVAAFNVLLERVEEPRRLLPLRGDGKREVYVAIAEDAAMTLCLAGNLEELSTNELMLLAGW